MLRLMSRFVTATVFGVFLFVAIFGLPVLLSHPEHHIGCPLMGAQTVMCESTVIEHFSIWQMMFASVVDIIVLVLSITIFFLILDAVFAQERIRIRTGARETRRPTLMQELFSCGILNRKEPFLFS